MTILNSKSTVKGFMFLMSMFMMSPSHALLVSLETDSNQVFSGEQVILQLWARDLGSDIVSGFDLDVNFEQNIVGFDSQVFGDALGDGIDSVQDAVQAGGAINLAEVSFLSDAELESLQSNGAGRVDVLLARLFFTANSVGNAEFSLGFDAVFGGLFGAGVADLSFELPLQPLLIEVQAALPNPVPEPETLAIVLIMLGGLAAKRERSRRIGK